MGEQLPLHTGRSNGLNHWLLAMERMNAYEERMKKRYDHKPRGTNLHNETDIAEYMNRGRLTERGEMMFSRSWRFYK